MAEVRPAHERVELLLQTAGFVTLATVDAAAIPWASTVNYVLLREPELRLVWYSMRDAQHSRNIEEGSVVSGSIFRTDLTPEQSPVGLDGIQLIGRGGAVPDSRAENIHAEYYRLNFPDEAVRKEWMLPLEQFTRSGSRRFYELSVEKIWLLDIERWLADKGDYRSEVIFPHELTSIESRVDGRL